LRRVKLSEQPLVDPKIKAAFTGVTSLIRSRIKLILALFLFGLVVGIPLSRTLVEYLLQTDIIPGNVNIILLTPVEFIMIQVRVGAWLGATLAITALIIELGWKSELSRRIPKPGRSVVLTILAITILSTAGLFYSWKLLTPMLLEYLADDAQSAGLNSEWRLSSFIGFILNLCIASVIGFQAPVITILALRSGATDRATLLQYRRHIWFATFVLGAAFSPPDPLSLFLVAIPVILLFEIAMFYDFITGGSMDVND
jgi:sec-independent protein translocase protein TatC